MQKILFLFLLLVCFSAKGQLVHDESHLDKSFWEFKVKLEACVLAENQEELKKYLADKILVSKDLCDDYGCSKEEFIRFFLEENPKETWEKLKLILLLGFKRLEDEYPNRIIPHGKTIFQAPSFKTKINEEEEVMILGERVNVREKPGVKGAIIQQVSYEKLACDCRIDTQKETTYQVIDGMEWLEVRLKRGKIGYVASKYCSSTLDKELTIAKVKGEWKIISFFTPMGC